MLEAKKCPSCDRRFQAEMLFCPDDGAVLKLSSQADMDPLIGQTLNEQFLVESILYSGATGTLYRAQQLPLERTVAIKVLGPLASKDPDALSRFEREARVSANLEHPNLVRVFFVGHLADQRPYFVMDYYPGISLADAVAKEKKLSVERICNIMLQLCEAISAMHAHGVVHNDIKKENVLLVPGWAGSVLPNTGDRPRDIVKLCDFGVASFAQEKGAFADIRDDVRALGLLAYELFVADAAFRREAESLVDLKVHKASRHLPTALADAVMRAIEKDPARRFQTVDGLAAALRASLGGSSMHLSMPLTTEWPMERSNEPDTGTPFKIALGVIAGLALVLFGTWTYRRAMVAGASRDIVRAPTRGETEERPSALSSVEAGKIEIMPSNPRINDNVSFIATWPSAVRPTVSSDSKNAGYVFVVSKKEGTALRPVEVSAKLMAGSSSTYIAPFRFLETGDYLVEFASAEAFQHSGPRVQETVHVIGSMVPKKPKAPPRARDTADEPLRGQLSDWPSESAPEEQVQPAASTAPKPDSPTGQSSESQPATQNAPASK